MSALASPPDAPPGVPSTPENNGPLVMADPAQPIAPVQPPSPAPPPQVLQPLPPAAAAPVPPSIGADGSSSDGNTVGQPSEIHAIPRAPPLPQDAAPAPVPPPVNPQPQPQNVAADAQSSAPASSSPPESSTSAQSSTSASNSSTGSNGSSTATSSSSSASTTGTSSSFTRSATQQPSLSSTGFVPTGPTDLNANPGGSTKTPVVSPGSSSSSDPFWSNQIIVISVWAGAGLILLIGIILCIRVRCRKKSKRQQLHDAHRHDAFLPSTAPGRFNPSTGLVRPTATVNPMPTASGGSGSYAVSAAELNAALKEEKEMAAREKEEEERHKRIQQHVMTQPAMMYHHQPHPAAGPRMRAPAPPPPAGVVPYQATPPHAYHPRAGSYYASSAPTSDVGYLEPATGMVYSMYGAPTSQVVHTTVPVPQQHHMQMEDLDGDAIPVQSRHQYEHQRVPSSGSSVLYAVPVGSRSASPALGMPVGAASGVAGGVGGGGAVYARPIQQQQQQHQAPGMTHSSSNYYLHDDS